MDEKRYADNPEELVALIRATLGDLRATAKRPEWAAKETQLREIASTISKLEKLKVEVPEDLRRLKTDLLGELTVRDEAQERLSILRAALLSLAGELGAAERPPREPTHAKERQTPSRAAKKTKDRLPTTPASELRRVMIEVLTSLEGAGSAKEVMDAMGQKMKDRLMPGDLLPRSSGELAWRNNARWERQRMVDERLLKGDSPVGRWELSDGRKRRP